MLIGAHVSTGGGLHRAVERGTERGCDAIQIFHQNPRMWRPTRYADEDFAAFRDAMEASAIEAIVIHAVYLINCASRDPVVHEKSVTSLQHALRVGDAIGSAGVVLHAGSRKGDPIEEAIGRVGAMVCECLADSESCPLLFENTAGTQGSLGRDFDELARLVEVAGGGGRIGVCIDCCHLFASGFEIRSREALAGVVDELDEKVGLERVRCLHVNDSAIPLGGNRDKHANLGKGELGDAGIATFLSEPRFDGLPALIETPGFDKKGPDIHEIETARRLRERGLERRGSR